MEFYLDDQGNLKENGLRGSPLGNLIGMMVVILVGAALLPEIRRRL